MKFFQIGLRRYPQAWFVLLYNLWPFLGIIFLDWSFFTLVAVYFFGAISYGFWGMLKASKAYYSFGETPRSKGLRQVAIYFSIFALFTLVWLVMISMTFGAAFEKDPLKGLLDILNAWPGLVVYFGQGAIDYWLYLKRDLWRKSGTGDWIAGTYGRLLWVLAISVMAMLFSVTIVVVGDFIGTMEEALRFGNVAQYFFFAVIVFLETYYELAMYLQKLAQQDRPEPEYEQVEDMPLEVYLPKTVLKSQVKVQASGTSKPIENLPVVELTGQLTLQDGEPFFSPISERPGVYWFYQAYDTEFIRVENADGQSFELLYYYGLHLPEGLILQTDKESWKIGGVLQIPSRKFSYYMVWENYNYLGRYAGLFHNAFNHLSKAGLTYLTLPKDTFALKGKERTSLKIYRSLNEGYDAQEILQAQFYPKLIQSADVNYFTTKDFVPDLRSLTIQEAVIPDKARVKIIGRLDQKNQSLLGISEKEGLQVEFLE